MKLAVFATTLAAATAFTIPSAPAAPTALSVNELELGNTAPLGVFDPLGWLDNEPETFERRRAVERKHGRIAMAAMVGIIGKYTDYGAFL